MERLDSCDTEGDDINKAGLVLIGKVTSLGQNGA